MLQSFDNHGKWWFWLDLKWICSVNHIKESRDGRVDSWRSFQAQGKKSKEKKNRSFLKPPKVKMEQRDWCSGTLHVAIVTNLLLCILLWLFAGSCIVITQSSGSFDMLQTSHPDKHDFVHFFFFKYMWSVSRFGCEQYDSLKRNKPVPDQKCVLFIFLF